MRRLLVAVLLSTFGAGCGSRTGVLIGGDTSAVDADGGSRACTTPPWILFSYMNSPVAEIYAMHSDGSGSKSERSI